MPTTVNNPQIQIISPLDSLNASNASEFEQELTTLLTQHSNTLLLVDLEKVESWDEYWQFHLQQEHKRNHLALYSSGIPLLKQVLKAGCSTTPPPLPIPV